MIESAVEKKQRELIQGLCVMWIQKHKYIYISSVFDYSARPAVCTTIFVLRLKGRRRDTLYHSPDFQVSMMKSCFCVWADHIPPCQRHLYGFHGHEAHQHPQTMSADAFPSSSLHDRGWRWCTERLQRGIEQRERRNERYFTLTCHETVRKIHIIQIRIISCVCYIVRTNKWI